MQLYFRQIILFFLILFAGSALPQQTKIKLKFSDSEKSVNANIKGGLTYINAKEFAEASKLKYFYNTEKQKIEYYFNDFNIKITANNSYIVKTSGETGTKTFQLPAPTILVSSQIYYPLEYMIEILKEGLKEEISFNKKQLQLNIGGALKQKETVAAKEEPENKPDAEAITESKISVSEKANGSLVDIKLNKKNVKYEASIKNNVLTLAIKDASLKFAEPEAASSKSLIKNIKFKKQNGSTLINFELRSGYESYDLMNGEDEKSILLTIRNNKFKRKTTEKKEKWDFDVVVIDAGHGGKDAGAVGIGGLKEKDVNLAVALKLGKLIESNIKGVKVVYTRKTDTFIELYKRGQIANENKGKLFISIHCNSTPQKPTDASGTEIYLLRPGRTESAIKIAERENSVIKYEDNPSRYQKLTDENFILVSMAHSSYMKYSEKFSDYLNNNFINEPTIKARGVRQAGFYVLIGASMPGVLVESGFISNPHDAQILGSKNGQTKISSAIFEAIKKFKDYYDKVIETES